MCCGELLKNKSHYALNYTEQMLCTATTTAVETGVLIALLIATNVVLYFAIMLNSYRVAQLIDRIQRYGMHPAAFTAATIATVAAATNYQPV